MEFGFQTPRKMLFGQGMAAKAAGEVAVLGACCLVVAGRSQQTQAQAFMDALGGLGVQCTLALLPGGEPTVQSVDAAAELARKAGCDVVLGLGGGSALDTAKAVAGIALETGSVKAFLEGVGLGRAPASVLPWVAAPTTSGTGSEATKNAVIMSREEAFKNSIRDDRLFARVAVVDPVLTLSCPPTVTAWSGMDALTQLIEAYISKKSQPMTDALALPAIGQAMNALLPAYKDGENLSARTGMAYASMVSGLCLANAGLGMVHGISPGMGALCGVPHGLACAVILPHAVGINLPHCAEKAPLLASAVCGRAYSAPGDCAKAVADRLGELNESMGIPKDFGYLGLSEDWAPKLAQACSKGSMAGNPVPMDASETAGFISGLL